MASGAYLMLGFVPPFESKLCALFRILRLRTVNLYLKRMFTRCRADERFTEMFSFFIHWIFCIHWVACLFVLPGQIAQLMSGAETTGAWFEYNNFDTKNIAKKYVICLTKSMETLMGIGFFSRPAVRFDRIYSTLVTVAGRAALATTLAYIYHFMRGIQNSRLVYDEVTVEVSKYVKHNRLPASSKEKLRKTFEMIFLKRCFDEPEIVSAMPSALSNQILIHNTRNLVDKSPFFQNLPWYLVLRIISALDVELFSANDAVLTLGEIGKSIFFIHSGSVALFSPRGFEICHLCDGDFFGETTLVAEQAEHQHMRVVALEMTECYKWVCKRRKWTCHFD